MMNKQEEFNTLINKYLEGNASREELSKLLNLLNSESANVTYFNKVCQAFGSVQNYGFTEEQTNSALEKLNKKILNYENSERKAFRNSHSLLNKTAFWRYAAIALLLICISGILFIIPGKQEHDSEETYFTVITPRNQKSRLILPDGTRVWLNCGSSLKYKTSYGINKRDIYLEGEAYFEVAKNAAKPFLVHASSITVRALGTRFNVKCYADDKTIETTLVEGKVEVNGSKTSQTSSNTVILDPNQKATFYKSGSKLTVTQMKVSYKVDMKSVQSLVNKEAKTVESVICWKDQQLAFEDEPFEEFIKRLERWYNVSIEVKDFASLAKNSYTGKFVNNESIEQVLKIISRTTPIKYSIEPGKIIVQPLHH